MGLRLADAHVHLGFMSNAAEVAKDAARDGLGLLAASVSPADYLRTRESLASTETDSPDVQNAKARKDAATRTPAITCALGAHPWWVADGRVGADGLALLEELAPDAAAFGEIGLDFSNKHADPGSHDAQAAAFARICQAAVQASHAQGRRIPLTIHSVRAAGACLDILEDAGALAACSPIFHWFSGSGAEMARAVEAGCWFSVNEHGLSTGRGSEYAKLVPAERLLLETDLPPREGEPFSAAEIEASLERALDLLAKARSQKGEGTDLLRALTTCNACRLFGWA